MTSGKKSQRSSLSQDFEALEKITQKLESGEIDLEQAIPEYKKGVDLAKKIKVQLTEFENKIEEINHEAKDFLESDTSPDESEN